jgi:FAD synthase
MALLRFVRSVVAAVYVEVAVERDVAVVADVMEEQVVSVAAVVIGPVDNRGLPKIEAHLMGFRGNLYGKKISLQLVKYIRPFRKFKGEKALKTQIQKDIILIKKLIPNAQLPISNKQAGK